MSEQNKAPEADVEDASKAAPGAKDEVTREPGQEDGQPQQLVMTLDEAALAAIKTMMDEVVASLIDQVDAKLASIEEKFESRITELAEKVEGVDLEDLKNLLGEATKAVDAIQGSGVADLASRLQSLEMRLRHTL